MARKHLIFSVIAGVLLLCLQAGCSAPPKTTMTVPTPSPPARIQTPEPFLVTYGGNGCTYSGPRIVPIGEHAFALKNLTEETVGLSIEYFITDNTTQDCLDLQGEPGQYFQHPGWSISAFLRGTEWDESLNGKVYTYNLTEAGENLVIVRGTNPPSIWFCPPIWVIDPYPRHTHDDLGSL